MKLVEPFTSLKTVTKKRNSQFSVFIVNRTTKERFRVVTRPTSETCRQLDTEINCQGAGEGWKDKSGVCGVVTTTGLQEHIEPVRNDRDKVNLP